MSAVLNRMKSKDSDVSLAAEEPSDHDQDKQINVNKVVWVVRVNIALYAACFWVQQSFLPYLADHLNVNTVWYGYLQTVFAVIQLAGGPLYGRYGDLRGARAAMCLAFGAAATQYALLAVTFSVPMLFISRLPAAFLHAMQGGQMVVTDLSSSSNRADSLAKLGVSYGVGMVCGPLVGGFVTKILGFHAAAVLACLGSVLSVLLSLYLIPQHTKRQANASGPGEQTIFNISKILSLLKYRDASVILIVKLIAGIPLGIFQSMFTMLALNKFGLEADKNGMLMAYIGVLSMLTQAFGVAFLTKRFTEFNLLRFSNAWLVMAYFCLALVSDIFQLCLALIPLCFGLSVMNAVVSSLLTQAVPDAETGAMLGLSMATHSVIRSISPTVGGILVKNFGFAVFGSFGCLISLLIAVFLLIWRPQS